MAKLKLTSKTVQMPDDVWDFIADLAEAEERSISYILRHMAGEFIRNDYLTRILPNLENRVTWQNYFESDKDVEESMGEVWIYMTAEISTITDDCSYDMSDGAMKSAELLRTDKDIREKVFANVRNKISNEMSVTQVLELYPKMAGKKAYFRGTSKTILTNGG